MQSDRIQLVKNLTPPSDSLQKFTGVPKCM